MTPTTPALIRHRGFAPAEFLVVLGTIAVLVALILPALEKTRSQASESGSISNLQALHAAQMLYAADWSDRQVQYLADGFSSYGTSATSALQGWNAQNGVHPPMTLGWGAVGSSGPVTLYAYFLNAHLANVHVHVPLIFPGAAGSQFVSYTSFRSSNARPLHNYLNGKFYDPLYYAPDDVVLRHRVEPLFDQPWEYVPTAGIPVLGSIPIWSSYCWSPAAMYHPDVMRSQLNGGWRNPWQLNHSMASPRITQAKYPSLKTWMLEHHWLRPAPPRPTNSMVQTPMPTGLSEPWQFNHSITARPLALMFDGSIGALANADVQAADQSLLARTGEGLWHRGTPFGASGYRGDLAFDDEVELSHHMLTVDGILGRDTVAGGW